MRRIVVVGLALSFRLLPGLAHAATPVEKCRLAVTSASAKLIALRLKELERCTGKILKCLSDKPGDSACLAEAGAACNKRLNTSPGSARLAALPAAEANVAEGIDNKCGGLLTTDQLFGAGGLEFERSTGRCAELGIEVTDGASLVQCLRDGAARAAERLFALPLPRARELLVLAGVDVSGLPELPGYAGCERGVDCTPSAKDDRKRLARCSAALVKAGRSFVASAFDDVTGCLEAASKCVDEQLTDKCKKTTRKVCTTAVNSIQGKPGKPGQPNKPGKRAKLAAAVSKACDGIDFNLLRTDAAVNVDALTCECERVGAAAPESLGAYQACFRQQHECDVADLARLVIPRGEDDLEKVLPGQPPALVCPLQASASNAAGNRGNGSSLRQFIRAMLHPKRFGRAIVKISNPTTSPGARSTIRRVTPPPRRLRPGGFNGPIVKYRLPSSTLRAGELVPPDAALLLRVRAADGSFADDVFELPLDVPEDEIELVVQYDPAVSGCRFDLAFATRAAGEISEFVEIEQSPEPRLPDAPALSLDINASPSGVGPLQLAKVGNRLFFNADDQVSGTELWTSDGTAGGTRQVQDLVPGFESSAPSFITDVGGSAFFAAVGGLWKSNGTPEGTVLVAPLTVIGSPTAPTALDDTTLMFFATDGTPGVGIELWRSDGTATGTTLVKDINPNGDSRPQSFVFTYRPIVVDGVLYFFAFDGSATQAWRSDGTPGGTFPLTASDRSLRPSGVASMNGQAFLSFAVQAPSEFRIIRSDGTVAGTETIFQSASGLDLAAVGARLFFTADDGTANALWTSDGSAGGASLVPGVSPIGALTVLNDKVFFQASDGTTSTVWVSDGTAGGTQPVPGLPADELIGGAPPVLVAAGGSVFFGTAKAGLSQVRARLWKTDGVAVTPVAAVRSGSPNGSYALTAVGPRVFFSGSDAEAGPELWVSDGTAVGTGRLANIDPATASAVQPLLEASAIGETLLFTARAAGSDDELWKSDGTAAGTGQVADINSGPSGSAPFGFVTLGTRAVFFADDGEHGAEPWSSDGKIGGNTNLLQDIVSGPTGSVMPQSLAPTLVGGFALFSTTPSGLWRTDGTPVGTQLVDAAVKLDVARGRAVVGGTLIFVNDDGTTGPEPWRSDGTPTGTRRLADLVSGSGGSNPLVLAAGSTVVYFAANDGTPALWKTNGTEGGTTRVFDIAVERGTDVSSPIGAVMSGDVLVFAGDDGSGPALWKSDGTGPGTVKVIPFTNALAGFTAAGGVVFFLVDDPNSLSRPWRTDGTAGGTFLLGNDVQLLPPFRDSLDTVITPIGDSVFFSATNLANSNIELWQSDGTVAGTRRTGDINPGLLSSGFKSGSRIYGAGSTVFFPANDSTTGNELWTLIPTP